VSELAAQVRGLSKRYPPREAGAPAQALFDSLDLDVAQGEFVAVEGRSGTGKSTLLHILGGLDRAFEGEVRVFGRALRSLADDELSALRHQQLGFVFQSFNLLPSLSALDNVLLPDAFGRGVPDASRRAQEALERVGLLGKAKARPAALSGGERQRVAIARALLVRPPLLLADEPTGNLDAATGVGVISLFRELHAGGMTLLIVTHEARVSHAASRVLVLREGKLTPGEEGT
jgi:putative ABC transport system ATP-binding protein